MRLPDLLDGLDRPIAFYPQLIKLAGSVNAALLLCQLAYWHGKQRDPDGWIFKRCGIATEDPYGDENVENQSIEAETGLTYHQQIVARQLLRARGVLKERYARSTHKLYFRVDFDALQGLWYGGRPEDSSKPEPEEAQRSPATDQPAASEPAELPRARLAPAESADGEVVLGFSPSLENEDGELRKARAALAESAGGTRGIRDSLIGTSIEYSQITPETSAETTREAAAAASRLDSSRVQELEPGGPLPKGPDEARELREMQIFEQVCGRLPRVGQYRSVLPAMRSVIEDRGLEHLEEYLVPFWNAWKSRRKLADGRPYDPGGVAWLTEWAVSGEIPAEPEVAQTTPDDSARQT